jgi:hypothetical protein
MVTKGCNSSPLWVKQGVSGSLIKLISSLLDDIEEEGENHNKNIEEALIIEKENDLEMIPSV